MRNIKITLLKNKKFTLENKDELVISEDENNETSIDVEFPREYEQFSKRVEFLNVKREKCTVGLYQPEDESQVYDSSFNKLKFTFTIPKDMAIRGELKMQFIAYLLDEVNTLVPFHIVVITIKRPTETNHEQS